MAFKLPNRILETTITTGTGTYTLAGAVSGYKTFASEMSNADTCFYFASAGADYEFGYGTYSASTLARTTVLGSSNADAAVSWAAGTKLIGVAPLGASDLDATNLDRFIGLYEAPIARLFPGRNILTNGGFQVAQRGDGPFTSATTVVNNDDTYLLDGCIFLANGTDTCDVSRVADTDFVSGRKIRLDVETGNRRFGVLFPIESAMIQAIRKSGKASVQFKVKRAGVTLTNVRAYLLAWSSTADAITSDVISAWNAVDTDPTFVANYTSENAGANLAVGTTIATHKIEDITVDTASITNLALLIISNATTTTVGDFLDIGDVQVEEGVVATDYEHRPISIDLEMCERYFEKTYHAATAPGTTNTLPGCRSGKAGGTTLVVGGFYFRTRKRTTPTVTLHSYIGTAARWSTIAGADTAAATVDTPSETGFLGVTSSGLTDNAPYYGHWAATAEL